MKVGLIGLGRTGEGMSRRMIEKGIEVWGYSSTNYENACGQYEAGHLSGCVTSLEYLVRAVNLLVLVEFLVFFRSHSQSKKQKTFLMSYCHYLRGVISLLIIVPVT